jgi:hypothetical protein
MLDEVDQVIDGFARQGNRFPTRFAEQSSVGIEKELSKFVNRARFPVHCKPRYAAGRRPA